MTKRKKIVLISVLSVAALFLLFIGYHYILYLKATSRMTELSADLEKRIAEWEKKEYQRQPLFSPSVPGNAAEFYLKAIQEEKENHGDIWARMQLSDAVDSPDMPISPELKAYIESNMHTFELVKQGANAETYKSPLNLHGDGWKTGLTGIGGLRDITRLMVLQGRDVMKENNTSEALKLQTAGIRLGDDTFRGGTIIGGLIGIALSSGSQGELLRILNNTELTDQQLTELNAILKALLDSEPSFINLCETEQLYMEAVLRQLSATHGLMLKNNELGVGPSVINRTDIVDAWEEYIPVIKELTRVISLPYAQMDEELDKFTKQVESLDSITQVILVGIGNLHKKYYTIRAQRQGLYILTALKLYRARHRAYPDKLSDLTPDIIKEVPLDPFTDQPFIYKIKPDGSIMLYSVGTNLKDDNGTASKYKEEDIIIAPYLRWQERK